MAEYERCLFCGAEIGKEPEVGHCGECGLMYVRERSDGRRVLLCHMTCLTTRPEGYCHNWVKDNREPGWWKDGAEWPTS